MTKTPNKPLFNKVVRITKTGRALWSSALLGVVVLAVGAHAGPVQKDKKRAPTKDDYVIDTSASSATLKVSETGQLSIAIKPKNNLKVHPQAPLEVKLKTSAGLSTEKNKLGRKQAKDQKAAAPELITKMTANAAGEQTVEANLSFFLCSDTWCQRVTDKATVSVKVE